MTADSNEGQRSADRATRRRAPRSPSAYAMAIYRAGTDDAVEATQRLTLASRAAAVVRFEDAWPAVGRSTVTRSLLRDWYMDVYQQQLDRGPDAPVESPIDGNRAEQLFLDIRETAGAPTDIVIDTVLTLARDARAFAGRVSAVHDRFVGMALAGRIGSLFPRYSGVAVGARQAIAEQWYLRAFHAELDRRTLRRPTPSIGRAEIARVVEDLAVGTVLHPSPAQSPIPESEADRQRHAALAWATLPDHRRLTWLTQHRFDERLYRLRWVKLPAPAQDLLLAEVAQTGLQTRPTDAHIENTLPTPDEAAAVRFATTVIHPARPADFQAARVLFHRGGTAMPPGLISGQLLEPVAEALSRLKKATPRAGQTRGLPSQGWWNDKATLDHAAQLRMNGAYWTQIGRELGVSPDLARYGLRHYGELDPTFTKSRPMRRWTSQELAAATALRAKGRDWNDIAVLIGRSSGKAVRAALQTANLPTEATRTNPARPTPPAPEL